MAKEAQTLKEAINGLERILGVLASFALTNGLRNIVCEWTEPNSTGGYIGDHIALFTSLLLTLIPFSHGAWQHLHIHRFNEEKWPRPQDFLLDFIFLLLEGLLFVALAFATKDATKFVILAAILLAVDVVFIGASLRFTQTDKTARSTLKKWLILDLVMGFVCGLLWFRCSNVPYESSLVQLRGRSNVSTRPSDAWRTS